MWPRSGGITRGRRSQPDRRPHGDRRAERAQPPAIDATTFSGHGWVSVQDLPIGPASRLTPMWTALKTLAPFSDLTRDEDAHRGGRTRGNIRQASRPHTDRGRGEGRVLGVRLGLGDHGDWRAYRSSHKAYSDSDRANAAPYMFRYEQSSGGGASSKRPRSNPVGCRPQYVGRAGSTYGVPFRVEHVDPSFAERVCARSDCL